MKLSIASEIFENHPGARLGVVHARGVDNTGAPGDLTALLREAEGGIAEKFSGVTVTEHPNIACWREAYRKFGAKPKKYPSSIENLVRRALKGEPIRRINPLVDLYNLVSLTHVLPAGGEDLDAVEGDIELAVASAGEPAVRLLGEAEARSPKAGEVMYRDNVGAICRRWNWKEADRTKLTETTTNAVLVLETLPPIPMESLQAALGQLQDLLGRYCGGQCDVQVLDATHPKVHFGS